MHGKPALTATFSDVQAPAARSGRHVPNCTRMWVELAQVRAVDYFGESAMLGHGRGLRHAAALASGPVEVLVLSKVDFEMKVDATTRAQIHLLVSCYPKDAAFVKCVSLLRALPVSARC